MSWLLSTLSNSILSRVVTCCHSFQVWNTIRSHFHGLTHARTTQLRLELRTIKKDNKSCTPHSVPANIPENHVVANYISAQGATMAVDRIAAVAHKVAVAKSSVRSARNVATKPQRVTAGWFVQLQHNFAPPNFGALQFFGTMQQPHFANGTTPTPWMPYLPGPHFQNPAPPFDSGASHHATNDPHNLLQSSTAAGNEHILMANGTVIPPNIHPMTTRSKNGILKPRLQPTLLLTHVVPKTVKTTLKDPKWKDAMDEEMVALLKNNTWELVPKPHNRQPIGCKWVFRVKHNSDGSVTTSFHWDLQQIDINNGFLNGKLEEIVYMQQPPGFEHDSNLVCKLNKALYGLKQAPRAWFEKLSTTLISLGFKASKCDPSLFVSSSCGNITYALVYVDDIILTGNNSVLIQQLISHLNSIFSLKHLGKLDCFLGIEVKYNSAGSVMLSQTKYISDLLERVNMEEAKGISTPMVSNLKLSKQETTCFENHTLYIFVVGALQYATITRPEISFSVNKVCQYMSKPMEEHWRVVKRILRYLKGTITHGLLIKSTKTTPYIKIFGFCDADWAADQDDRRSTLGACIFLGPNLVPWWAKNQVLVAKSTTEAEYRSLTQVTSEILWLESLLKELHIPFDTPLIFYDNQSSIALAHNPVLHACTKHMELDIFFVREIVLNKDLVVSHIPSQEQVADIMTKPLSTSRFLSLRGKLNVVDCANQPP
ncbi:Retrovirus-related Pol polyprotein from transposon RE1 [Glycine soja]|uniref:Retrovirus-related Pol polyprotein from transposon RE1 n=1 Tax=Glycine soja TaxID=3848 RepID=A0A445HS50_GLYSO|nr:Retrovirus-related Pol polyprotein from transposon RE1 [Glycine soja]